MRTGKVLLLSIAAAAILMGALTSSALGADGVIRDVSSPNNPIANGTTLNSAGWWRSQLLGSGVECHVTSEFEAGGSGTTGRVLSFTPNTSSCHGFGAIYEGCKVSSDSVENLPYAMTVTPEPTWVTVAIFLIIALSLLECETPGLSFTNISAEELWFRPLKTGSRVVTNTSGRLGTTAAQGEAIAGFEIEGEGETENNFGVFGNIIEGELEITGSNRCTYKITAS